MQNAYNQCKQGDFAIEIVEVLSDEDDINAKEIYWINYYDSANRENGYNKTLGGDGGNGFFECLTEEEKQEYLQKRKEIYKGKHNPNYGKHCYTDGVIIKYISDDEIEEYEANGWYNGVPDRVKEKERLANLGEKNGFYGKKHSEETKAKLSEKRKGKNNWNYGKVIYHKGEVQKYIDPKEVKKYEANGWEKGVKDSAKKKISNNNKKRKFDKPSKLAKIYCYKGEKYYGWRKLKEYLNQNGYSKISESSIIKLANGKHVRGYDDLFGKITILEKEDL